VRRGRYGCRGGYGVVVEAAAPAGGGGREEEEGGSGDRGGGAEVRDVDSVVVRHRGRHGGGDGARSARRPPRAAQDAHQLRQQPPYRVSEPRAACS
jgi:hypothetical protein